MFYSLSLIRYMEEIHSRKNKLLACLLVSTVGVNKFYVETIIIY